MPGVVGGSLEPRVDAEDAVGFQGADPGLAPLGPITPATAVPVPVAELRQGAALPSHVKEGLVRGTSTLAMGMVIERGTGFLANILAARLGGAMTFGAYSLAISTANQISTYAAGQIGATATRFSGKYPFQSRGYGTLAKALLVVSLLSAALAGAGLWLTAGPLARLLGKPALEGLLRWAAVSAAGIVLLECARGFFVGQRKLLALLLLSCLVGGGMVCLLPLAARAHSPVRMIVSQGLITSTAVLVCLLLMRPLKLLPARAEAGFAAEPQGGAAAAPGLGTMLREIWSFGLVQLAGLVGSNLAGWWLTTLVARADTTLVEMSFFAIASQLRNLAGIAPGLLTEGSYAVMADPDGGEAETPQRVMALCGYASATVAFALAAGGIVVLPWGLGLLYGRGYVPAALAVALGLAIAVVHMGNAPAAARLTIVSIRATGVINTAWAAFVAVLGVVVLLHGGRAWEALGIYFVAHVLSAGLVLLTLRRKDRVPAGVGTMYGLTSAGALGLVLLAGLRAARPAEALLLTALMCVVAVALMGLILRLGKRRGWLPPRSTVGRLLRRFGVGRAAA